MIEQSSFASIAEKAEQDLISFFLECTEPKILTLLKSDPYLQNLRRWNQRCKKIYGKINDRIKEEQRKGDKGNITLPAYTDAFESLCDLLLWLEERKAQLVWPWKRGLTRREIEDPDISYLLNLFKKTFLDGLCLPLQGTPSLPDIWLLKKFLEFVGWSKKLDGRRWHVIPVPLGPKEGPVVPTNFTSWLFVADTLKTLYIPYNEVEIRSGTNNGKTMMTRLGTVFLHELGHAVNRLDWFIYKLKHFDPKKDYWCIRHAKGTKWVGAPASHEFGAWAYAFAIRGWVKSTRSWIRRLVEEKDDELFNP